MTVTIGTTVRQNDVAGLPIGTQLQCAAFPSHGPLYVVTGGLSNSVGGRLRPITFAGCWPMTVIALPEDPAYAVGRSIAGHAAYAGAPDGTCAQTRAGQVIRKTDGVWVVVDNNGEEDGPRIVQPFTRRTIVEDPRTPPVLSDLIEPDARWAVGQTIGDNNEPAAREQYDAAPVGTVVREGSGSSYIKDESGLWYRLGEDGSRLNTAPEVLWAERTIVSLPSQDDRWAVGNFIGDVGDRNVHPDYADAPVGTWVHLEGERPMVKLAGAGWTETSETGVPIPNCSYGISLSARRRIIAPLNPVAVPSEAVEAPAGVTPSYAEALIDTVREDRRYTGREAPIEGGLMSLGLVEYGQVGAEIRVGSAFALPVGSVVRVEKSGQWAVFVVHTHDECDASALEHLVGDEFRLYPHDLATIVGIGSGEAWPAPANDADLYARMLEIGASLKQTYGWCEDADDLMDSIARPAPALPSLADLRSWPTFGLPEGSVLVGPTEGEVIVLRNGSWSYADATQSVQVLDGDGQTVTYNAVEPGRTGEVPF